MPLLKKTLDVQTGKVKIAKGDIVIKSIAIGSCIAITVYDVKKRIGGLAHIMLPGKAPGKTIEKTRYSENAIDELLIRMAREGSRKSDAEMCLVGAGNVLKKPDDTICSANIESTTQLLKKKNIPIRATMLGGTDRKGVFLDVASGTVSCTTGDGSEKVLWKPTVLES